MYFMFNLVDFHDRSGLQFSYVSFLMYVLLYRDNAIPFTKCGIFLGSDVFISYLLICSPVSN